MADCAYIDKVCHRSLYNTIRVKWGGLIGNSFSITNGVKQGGVMSPLLFTVYIDELLTRLSCSHAGCYIGDKFHGAYGYADDVIILAPSLRSLDKLLDICSNYAIEYNVMFNSAKSKMIVYSPHALETVIPDVYFMGGNIEVVPSEKHLGNYIGNITQKDLVSRITNDFLCRVNMVKSHFKHLPVDTIYYLFKSYCMPLYGSLLWDLGSPL